MSYSLKIYNKIYSKTKLHATTLSLPPFWQCAHTQFNPVMSHATNDSHRLSRLTQSLACHGLSQRVLRHHLPCIVCHCPPSAHSVHLGQLHHSLRTGLSAFTGCSSATMATTRPCSATLANLITKTHLSDCRCSCSVRLKWTLSAPSASGHQP